MFQHRLVQLTIAVLLTNGLVSSRYLLAQSEVPAEPSVQASLFGEAVRSTDPRSPQEEIAGFHVPEGFVVDLVASEPQIAKPMNMAFDDRGRLWVTQTVEYPYPAKDPTQSRDQIRILEDKDGDGVRETVTVFADQVNIPIGILPYQDGCFCFSIPNLYRLRDTDGDGKCDVREVVLGPFDTNRDTHGMVNSLRLGIDGWIYANHGYNNQSTVQGKDGIAVSMTSGNTFRFRPDGSSVQLFTQGQVNPFGSVEDDWGTFFTADCHSKPITQLIWGGCYPSFGRPDDGLGFVASTMEHLHGSTAIAGVSIGSGSEYPKSFQENFFSGNVMTSRINRNRIVRTGATVKAEELPDLLTSDDPWFRPVDVVLGPDGAMYVADFYNKVIGHYEVPLNHPGRDRDRGRIFRIRYAGKPATNATKAKVAVASKNWRDDVANLASTNPLVRRNSLERLVANHAVDSKPSLERMLQEPKSTSWQKIGALWALARINQALPSGWNKLTSDPSPLVRNHLAMAAREFAKDADIASLREWFSRETQLDPSHTPALRSLVECLGVHGDAADVKPMLTLMQARSSDPILSQCIRIAVRRVLRKGDVVERVVGNWGNAAAEKTVVSLPIESPLAKDLLPILIAMKDKMPFDAMMAWMVRPGSETNVFTELLPQLATSISIEKSKDLLPVLAKHYANDPSTYSQMLLSILDSQKQTYGKVAPEVELGVQTLITEWMKNIAQNQSGQFPVQSWHSTGLTSQPWPMERRKVAGENGDDVFFSSLGQGEDYVGTWESGWFTPPSDISFLIVGHNGMPNQDDHHRNRVQLVQATTNQVIQEAFPPRSDIAQLISWNLKDWPGGPALIRVVDGDNGDAYAWIGIGRLSITGLNPSGVSQSLEQIASLASKISLPVTLDPEWNNAQKLDDDWQARLASISIRNQRSLAAALLEYASKRGWGKEIKESAEALNTLPWDSAQWNDSLEQTLFQQIARRSTGIQQREIVRLLATRRDWWPMLAMAIEKGWLGAEGLVKQNQAWWNALPDDETGNKLRAFRPSDANAAEELLKLVEQRTIALQSTAADIESGKGIFKERCSNCHQLGGQGTVLGPQLEGVGGRGLQRLAEDILQPNRNVDEAFRMTTFVMDDGDILLGLVKSRSDDVIQAANQKGESISIPVASIESEKRNEQSLMPSNFGELLNDQQLADLIGFLRKQAEKKKE